MNFLLSFVGTDRHNTLIWRFMARKRFEWKLSKRTLQLGERALIVGVLNVTPDSFSDGGKYQDPDRAFARAIELEEQGADIIDVGAESTRPGSKRISEAEELRRLVPVLKRLRNKLNIPISVDTYKAAVAEKALELGAEIINDPSSLTFDPELAKTVLHYGAGLILNHMRGTPETWAKLPPLQNLVPTIVAELEASAHRATRVGVDRKAIVIDPGLGFGKRREQNAEILANLGAFVRLEFPIMVGPSRKHFLAKDSTDATEFATAAAVTASVLGGAHMVRVHDVAAMKAVVEVAEEILRAGNLAQAVQAEVVRPGQRPGTLPQERGPVSRSDKPRPVNPRRDAPRPDGPRPDNFRPTRPPTSPSRGRDDRPSNASDRPGRSGFRVGPPRSS